MIFVEKAVNKLDIPGSDTAHQRPGMNTVPMAGPIPGKLNKPDIYEFDQILIGS